MKIVGTIKSPFPLSAFTPVILKNNKNDYFIQVELDGVIKDFKPINLPEDKILLNVSNQELKIGDSIVFCYTFEDSSIIIGTLLSLKNKLFQLLGSDKINAVAKSIISSRYKIHNKTVEFVKESNENFKKRGLNCKLKIKNYINTDKYKDNTLDNFLNELSKIGKFIDKKNNIALDDFINITSKKIYISSYKLKINKYFSMANSNGDKKNIGELLIGIIIYRLRNGELSENIFDNKDLYQFILCSKEYNKNIDAIVLKNEKSSKFIPDNEFERTLKNIHDKNNYTDENQEELLKLAQKVKDSFKQNE